MIKFFLLIVLIVATIFFQKAIPPIYHHSDPLTFLPTGPLVELTIAPLGPIGADLIWLIAIQYYGEEKLTGGEFKFLFDVYEVLTRIDPQFLHAYQIGSIVIADDGQDPDRAIKILRRGCINNPSSWIPPFYIGFINYFYKDDYFKAAKYFEWSARLPDAPEFTYRLSAVSFKKSRDRKASILAWSKLYESTNNQTLKNAALRNIKYLIIEEHLEILNNGLKDFNDKYGKSPRRADELIPEFIEKIPDEPFGGRYLYDAKEDSFTASSYLKLKNIVNFLNTKLSEFKGKYGYYPEKLDELVARGLIRSIPPHPLGARYRYQKGKVD